MSASNNGERSPLRTPSFEEWSTEELVGALKRKDERAWSQLERNVRSILMLGDRKHVPKAVQARFDTEDICQSVMLRAFSDIASFEYRGEESFRRWLVTIFANRLRSRMRAHTAQRRELGREQQLSPELTEAQPASFAVHDEDMERAERLAALVCALSKLPTTSQRIIAMRISERLSCKETALALDISERSVGRQFAQALTELRGILGD